MILKKLGSLSQNPTPLSPAQITDPVPDDDEILVRLSVCGVCHTEIDEIEGRTPPPELPVVPGHQAVGIIEETGRSVRHLKSGDRVGIAWIFSACGVCSYCESGRENLCPEFQATGRDVNGGYAQYMTVPARFAHPIPDVLPDVDAAPLLCAGAIGYRSLKLTRIENGQSLGLTGFGASAHLVLLLARFRFPETPVFVFTRNALEREFALELGAAWAGHTSDTGPEQLHAIVDTTPVWKPVVEAMRNLLPGGRLVINAIRKEAADQEYLMKLDYPEHLWMEKEIKSVANVTRADVREFLDIAAEMNLKPEIQEYELADANTALTDLKRGGNRGAKILRID